MSSLMERCAEPMPMPTAMDGVREGEAYNVSATILRQYKTGFEPLLDHENLSARVYPYSQGQTISQFDVNRKITDRIKFEGYFPRMNSSFNVRVLEPNGETVMYDVHDVEHDGDPKRTSLIVRRRGVDKN